MPHNIYNELPFLPLVKALEAISAVKPKPGKVNEKKRYLKLYIDAFDDAKEKFIAKNGPESYTNFFPVLRLLLPSQDNSRSYGIKETVLGRLYTNVLALGAQSSDAALLKSGTLNKDKTDFADVVYEVMKNRTKEISICKITDINDFLDKLSEENINVGTTEFTKICLKLTALEHKWLVRIIFKNLHLELSEQAILTTFHPKAGELFNQIFSLEKICDVIEKDENFTDKLSIEPFVPLRPQLCDRMIEKQIEDILVKQEMYAETKMDGERFQIHRKGDNYRYFTRHGKECTEQFGKNAFSGIFTPLIHGLFKISVENFILDGEMMVWDKHDLRLVVKGENVAARTMKNLTKYQSCFVAYDLLYLNGVNFMSKQYHERISALKSLFEHSPGKLMTVKREKVRSSKQVLEVLNNAIDNCEEGIVLKKIDSIYCPGKRGEGWFKVKPDYLGDLVTDLDLVVIGGLYKKGTNFVQKYFVAIKDETRVPTKYVTVTPIVNNLSADDAKVMQKILKPISYDPLNPPACLDFGVYKPNIYYEPQNSVILEVKASELQKSSSVSTGYILRFPRVTQIRKDKPPTDCCDIKEFQNLCDSKNKVIKLPKRHATESDLAESHKRKRQKVEKTVEKFVNPYASSSKVVTLDNIAHGLQIAILSSGKDFPPKEELEMLVRKHGGTVVAHAGRDTNFCVAHTETPMVMGIKKSKSHTIVNVPWFLKAFPKDKIQTELPDIRKKDTLCMKPEFEVELRYKYDEWDDPWTKETTKEELKEHLKDMKGAFQLMNSEYDDIERTIIGRKDIYNCFRGEFAYFNDELFKTVDYKVAKLGFLARSGNVIKELSELETGDKIVVDTKYTEEINGLRAKVSGGAKFIDFQYYLQISKGFVSQEKDYLIK